MNRYLRGALIGLLLVVVIALQPFLAGVLIVTVPYVPLPIIPTILIGGMTALMIPPPGGWASAEMRGLRVAYTVLPLFVVIIAAAALLAPRAGIFFPLSNAPELAPGGRVPVVSSMVLGGALALALEHALAAGAESMGRASKAIARHGMERIERWRPLGYGVLVLIPIPAWVLDNLPPMPLWLGLVTALGGATVITLLLTRVVSNGDDSPSDA